MINTNVTLSAKTYPRFWSRPSSLMNPSMSAPETGNVVVLSEDDYRGILETLEMNANPVMKQKLLEGKDTPLSECIPETNAADL